MKSLRLACALCWFIACSSNVLAQRFDLGVAGVYGDDITTLGQNTRFYVNSNDHRFCFGPEFTWFGRDTEQIGDETLTRELIEFNFNSHINFELIGKLGFYALIGVNYSREREEIRHLGDLEEVERIKEWGFNLGSGLHYELGPVIAFAEYDHLFSDLRQNTFTLGLLVGFGKIKGHSGNHTEHAGEQ